LSCLTGNPVDIFLNINRTPEQLVALNHRLHLDQPLPVQFLIFLRDLLQGDFGPSAQFSDSTAVVVWNTARATFELPGTRLALGVLLGLGPEIACAVWKDRFADAAICSVAISGQSMPTFWLDMLLIQYFAPYLHWLLTSGYVGLAHLVLPVVTLAAILLPNFVMITRNAIVELANEQFVVTGRAKDLSRAWVLLTNVLPNAVNLSLAPSAIRLVRRWPDRSLPKRSTHGLV
jgi:ABC-type dipeptide/oligopeptide/nickel transport system permease component